MIGVGAIAKLKGAGGRLGRFYGVGLKSQGFENAPC
jgi:hypothetical protein